MDKETKQQFKQHDDRVEVNSLTNLIHNLIREFRIKKFEADVQEASNGGNIWKLANKGKGGVKYDAIGRATAVAECLKDQFK